MTPENDVDRRAIRTHGAGTGRAVDPASPPGTLPSNRSEAKP